MMRKIGVVSIVLCGLFVGLGAQVWAQDSAEPPKSVLSTNVRQLMMGMWNLDFETALNKRLALDLHAAYYHIEPDAISGYSMGVSSLWSGIGLHYYPVQNMQAPEGLWLGPELEYVAVFGEVDNTTAQDDVYGLILKMCVGYKLMLGASKRFTIQPYAGVLYSHAAVDGEFGSVQGGGMGFDYGLNVGFAF